MNIVDIKNNLDELARNAEIHTSKTEELAHTLFTPFQQKYGSRVTSYGIGEETFGGRASGKLASSLEMIQGNTVAGLLKIHLSYSPSAQESEIIYARHATDNRFEFTRGFPTITQIQSEANNLHLLVSGADESFMYGVKKNSVSIGGKVALATIAQAADFLIDIDNRLDSTYFKL